ncbi:MAG: twin-arginine translocase subunit TatC [Elusimicrobia bacterium]|nr:twin-arginine translocase subunit TatC [Elusimicrobiota bacterium]
MFVMTNEQTITQHLEELRGRLWIVVLSFFTFSLLGYWQSGFLLDYFSISAGPFVFLTPAGAFLARMKIAVFSGLFLSLPVIFFEVWRFVASGLTARERGALRWLFPLFLLLFMTGVFLAIALVIPAAFRFLLNFQTETIRPMITVDAYLSFALFTSLAFGVVFEFPLVIFALGKMGIVSHGQLAHRRRMIYLGILVAAAVLTPGPDIFSMLILALPTVALFEVSLLLLRADKA